MPRRNRRPKVRSLRSQTPPEEKPMSTDQMARDLVRRGLASSAIISGPPQTQPRQADRKDDDDAKG